MQPQGNLQQLKELPLPCRLGPSLVHPERCWGECGQQTPSKKNVVSEAKWFVCGVFECIYAFLAALLFGVTTNMQTIKTAMVKEMTVDEN